MTNPPPSPLVERLETRATYKVCNRTYGIRPCGVCQMCEERQELRDAAAELARMEEALRWYASEDQYKTDMIERGENADGLPMFTRTTHIALDNGEKARAALARKEAE